MLVGYLVQSTKKSEPRMWAGDTEQYLIVKVPGDSVAAPRAIIAAREAMNDKRRLLDASQSTKLPPLDAG